MTEARLPLAVRPLTYWGRTEYVAGVHVPREGMTPAFVQIAGGASEAEALERARKALGGAAHG